MEDSKLKGEMNRMASEAQHGRLVLTAGEVLAGEIEGMPRRQAFRALVDTGLPWGRGLYARAAEVKGEMRGVEPGFLIKGGRE